MIVVWLCGMSIGGPRVVTGLPTLMSQTAAILDAHAGAAFILSGMPIIHCSKTSSFSQHSRSPQLCPGLTSLPEPSGPCRRLSSVLELNAFETVIQILFGSELRKSVSQSQLFTRSALMDPSPIS